MASDPIVIVGFGTAATSAVIALRAAGYSGRIAVITDDAAEPYSPVLTSYYASGRICREQCNAWADLDIPSMVDHTYAHAHVSTLNPKSHEIVLEDGRLIRYSKLLIATGAHPVAPGFPHVVGFEPLVLRTMRDADLLEGALRAEDCRNVLVAGTSMVALKALEACLDRDVRVTLVGRSAHILRNSAHPAIASRFEQLLGQRGVALRLNQTVERCECPGKTGCIVTFSQGDAEHFDEVVLAQGVKPNLDFVANGTIEINQGLVVDQFMRTSAPDVFAAGDVAQALDLTTGEKRIIGLWQNAVRQARCAACAMVAELEGRSPTRPFVGSIPANVIHVRDIMFASAGSLAEGENRRQELCEADDFASMLVYEQYGSAERLVGFNILTLTAPDGKNGSTDELIGQYRAEVRKSFLDDART